jgi:hypothetical protein
VCSGCHWVGRGLGRVGVLTLPAQRRLALRGGTVWEGGLVGLSGV